MYNSVAEQQFPGCGSVWGAMGAPPAAESSDLSEWQRSIADAAAPSARKISGTATGRAPALAVFFI